MFKNTCLILCLIPLLSGCLEGNSSTLTSISDSSTDETTNENTDDVTFETLQVSVGIGRAGAIVTSHDGFQTLSHSEQKFVPGVDYTDPAITEACRFGAFEPYAPDHDPHMFRGIAFGNNKFVAVGGCCHAVSRTSSDGVNWTNEVIVDKDTVTFGSCPWAGDVTFGEGVFVSFGGGVEMWSADGENWQRVNWATQRPGGGFRRVEYENGYFIGVGSDPAPVIISTDGINWDTEESVSLSTTIASGAEVFIAKDLNDPTQLRIFNTNTEIWELGEKFSVAPTELFFSKSLNKFFLRSDGINYESLDGYTWVEIGPSSYAVNGYANGYYFNFRRSWGVTASSTRYVSTDAINWTLAESRPFNPIIDSISAEVQVPVE